MPEATATPATNPYSDPEYAHAAMAQSDRMRGRTVSIRDRVVATHGRAVSARRPRARGAGRPKGQSTRSSAKSGDSGDDGPSEEPPQRRLCGCNCGSSIERLAPQARYLTDAHRKRHERALARAERERVGDHTDRHRRDPYEILDPETRAWLLRRIEGGCRCNGSHILDETGAHCIKCGHDRGSDPGGRSYVWARSAETRRQRKAEVLG
jgi:hypothetical protein